MSMRTRSLPRWAAGAVLVGVVATLVAGWGIKARCLTDGGWSDGEQYHEYCYSDFVSLWYARDLGQGAVPYLDSPVEYPVVLGGVMWATAGITRALPGEATAARYFHVNAVAMALVLLVALGLIARIGIALPPVAWWAAAPVVALTAFINWDAVPVALLAGAILLHQRGRDTAAGVLVGVGTAAKLYPAFLLPLIVIARWREGRRDAAARHVAAAAVTWLVLNVPVALAAPSGWNRFLELNRARDAHVDSLWYAVAWLGGPALEGPVLNVAASALFAAGAVAIVIVGVGRRPAMPVWALVAPVVLWFVVTNKVWSPQFSLWVVALLAVTLRRAWPFVAFAAADVAVHLMEFAVLGGRSGFTPAPGEGWLVLTTTIRGATVAWLIITLLREPIGSALPRDARVRTPAGVHPAPDAPARGEGLLTAEPFRDVRLRRRPG